MHRLVILKDMQQLPTFNQILTKFTTKEVIAFPFEFQVLIIHHHPSRTNFTYLGCEVGFLSYLVVFLYAGCHISCDVSAE